MNTKSEAHVTIFKFNHRLQTTCCNNNINRFYSRIVGARKECAPYRAEQHSGIHNEFNTASTWSEQVRAGVNLIKRANEIKQGEVPKDNLPDEKIRISTNLHGEDDKNDKVPSKEIINKDLGRKEIEHQEVYHYDDDFIKDFFTPMLNNLTSTKNITAPFSNLYHSHVEKLQQKTRSTKRSKHGYLLMPSL